MTAGAGFMSAGHRHRDALGPDIPMHSQRNQHSNTVRPERSLSRDGNQADPGYIATQ